MNTSATKIERIVQRAGELRIDLIDAAGSVHPNNLADDGRTTVQAALLSATIPTTKLPASRAPSNRLLTERWNSAPAQRRVLS
jgi:hypothetical protein